MDRIVSGDGCPVFQGTRKPAPDHRASPLRVQQCLVLLILSIHVRNHGKNI